MLKSPVMIGCGCSGGEKESEVTVEDREWFRKTFLKMEDDRY